jgi:hypothetical protein
LIIAQDSAKACAVPASIVYNSGPIPTSAPIAASVELILNSDGHWAYRGHFHNSGAVGLNCAVSSAPVFQAPDGHVLVVAEEGYVGGTFSVGKRDYEFEKAGFEPLIRKHWDALRSTGMRTRLEVNIGVTDVAELVIELIPLVVGTILLALVASGEKKVCPGVPYRTVDPDGTTHEGVSFPITGKDEPCPATPP